MTIGSVKELRQELQRDQTTRLLAAQGAANDAGSGGVSVRKAKAAVGMDLTGM